MRNQHKYIYVSHRAEVAFVRREPPTPEQWEQWSRSELIFLRVDQFGRVCEPGDLPDTWRELTPEGRTAARWTI